MGAASPFQPDLQRLALAAEGVARRLALRVVAEADERLGKPLDSRPPEEPQVEVVVGGVDVALVEQPDPLEQAPPEDDRRCRDEVAEVEVASPAVSARPGIRRRTLPSPSMMSCAEDGFELGCASTCKTARSTASGAYSSSPFSQATSSPPARENPLLTALVWPRSGSETHFRPGRRAPGAARPCRRVEPPSTTMCSCGSASRATLSSVAGR